MPKLLSTLRSLANAILGKTGKPDRLDTATRMAVEADFRGRGEPSTPEREPTQTVDPIDELMRIIGSQEPPPRPAKAVPDRRQRSKGRR